MYPDFEKFGTTKKVNSTFASNKTYSFRDLLDIRSAKYIYIGHNGVPHIILDPVRQLSLFIRGKDHEKAKGLILQPLVPDTIYEVEEFEYEVNFLKDGLYPTGYFIARILDKHEEEKVEEKISNPLYEELWKEHLASNEKLTDFQLFFKGVEAGKKWKMELIENQLTAARQTYHINVKWYEDTINEMKKQIEELHRIIEQRE